MNHEKIIKTTCPYCGVGCGVVVNLDEQGVIKIKGDPDHPANYGRLCSKGSALADSLGMEGRLLYPEINGNACSWGDALNVVSHRLKDIIEKHGKESVAFYVSGQLLTEDYYVANKLVKGFIGTANIDTNSRLCMSSAVAAQKRAFGSDSVPGCYEDLERARLIILAGSNTAWCHPVVYQRIVQAKKDNPDLVVALIDPRQTATADIADIFLPIKPGTDSIFFNGLLVYLQEQDEHNIQFIKNCTEGMDEALDHARQSAPDIASVAAQCELDEEEVTRLFRLFAHTERVVTVFSQGINQFSSGTDRVNSIINCHLLTGRIGRPGMGPFSLTGQPNAMGGREVGGLANQLAAHMELDNEEHRDCVQTFWQSPHIADKQGLKAVDLFDAMYEGDIKAVWIMGTNPAVSMPDSNKVREALKHCELVIVSDCMRDTDTTQFADILLPAQTWSEKDGTVTNSERRVSRQRSLLPIPGEAKADWWIISEVAKRMGFEKEFSYNEAADIFFEHAALSGYRNNATRDFDISAWADMGYEAYDNLQPTQWPIDKDKKGTKRLFTEGQFYTPSGKARFVAVTPRPPAIDTDDEFPLVLNTGRVRDHWHTLTRTGHSARLSGHISEPYVEIHPKDLAAYSLEDKSLACITSKWGEVIVRVTVTEQQRIGSVFIPMHWNQQFASQAGVDMLINPAVDPISGQPEFKYTPVNISTYQPQWYGFILSRRRLKLTNANYWVCSKGRGYWKYEIGGDDLPGDWAKCARSLLCSEDNKVDWIEYFDNAQKKYRAARLVNNKLESCVFIGPDIHLPERDYLADLFGVDVLSDQDRASLLTGKPPLDVKERGPIVCSCFNVGLNEITELIKEKQPATVEEIGACIKAGTNCGSCIPEIKKILLKV
ncbi:MAG: molybdopterin-dependent oxidoreductase [Gammaproteobacteria bacterium]|nr:molybdopterin-dependent oxidoreductase [Gammaproteobacteria bacterium]